MAQTKAQKKRAIEGKKKGECINCWGKTSRKGNGILSFTEYVCKKCHDNPTRYIERDRLGRPVTTSTPASLRYSKEELEQRKPREWE
tara:strand:+ start:149 stop:409 length:261 start_codon:yes stop_codon:yes gene_type:complete